MSNSIEKITKNCQDALAKAHIAQEITNAIITFYDIDSQIDDLKNVSNDSLLYGMPIVLKDNINTKGVLTTASSGILDNYLPVYDACIVEKLKNAGAIIIGKSSMDELGMGGTNTNAYRGAVKNPLDPKRIAGGSSGGSAISVASGVVGLAIGTDTGDSVRKPAAYTGVIGVKPTYGRISRYGIIPYASSLDHVGYFTNNIENAAKALHVLAGRDDRDMTSSNHQVDNYFNDLKCDVKGKRIAVIENVQSEIKNKVIREQFNVACEELVKQGAIVEYVHFNDALMEAILPVYYIIANAEATANHSNLDGIRFGERVDGKSMEEIMINTRTKGFCSYVRKRFIAGSYSLFVENQDKVFRKAQKVRRLIVEELKKVLANYDLVMASATSDIAPLVEAGQDEHLGDDMIVADNHMIMGNFSGLPSITIPCGKANNMPIGINLTANAFEEQLLFNAGSVLEKIGKKIVDDCEVQA